MRRLLRRAVVVALVVGLAFAARPPAVSADDASEARLEYERGREAYARHQWRDALGAFLASNRLARNPRVMANVGACYHRLRQDREAFNWYEAALQAGLEPAFRRSIVRARDGLRPRLALVSVDVDPDGASLFVDRPELGEVGVGDRLLAVDPGRRVIIARADGFRDARLDVDARVGAEVSAALTLPPLRGQLVVESEPPGVEVTRVDDGEVLGATPLSIEVPVGPVEIVLRAEGHEERTARADVQDGETSRLSLRLAPLASRLAVLSVRGEPDGARIRLDGELLGEAPLTRDALVPGRRLLRLEADGREPWEGAVVLEAGGASRVSFRLRDPRGGPGSLPFAVGYGVGAAALLGGVGSGIAALVAHDRFFDEPSQRRRDQLDRLNLAADVLLITGAVVALTTLLLDLLIAGPPPSAADVELDR